MTATLIVIALIQAISGAWIFSDGLYSILLYLNKPAYHGRKQTWKRDHWIRCVRSLIGILWIVGGFVIARIAIMP